MSLFDTFAPEEAKAAIKLALAVTNNPGITHEALDLYIDYFHGEGRTFLHEELDGWDIADEPDEPDEDCESGFNISIHQTHQLNGECGLWFEYMWLRITYELDGLWKWESPRSGEVFIKDPGGRVGKFKADFSEIPCSAKIVSAKLYGHLEPAEGLANGDHESTFEVRDANGLVHKFSAGWMHSVGWSKRRSDGHLDLTDYVNKIRNQT